MHLHYILLLLLLCCTIGFGQDPSPQEVEEALNQYRTVYKPEKVYVHTDKDLYRAGETIWYAAYLVDGQSHLPLIQNKALKVELINGGGKIVQKQKLLLPIGRAAGDFSLPGELPAGDYQLRAYTNYQRNFSSGLLFTKKIRILPGILADFSGNDYVPANVPKAVSEDFPPTLNVQFFPEGGDCINGLSCRLAFLAGLEDGRPAAVSGRIEADNGKIITFFESVGRGMGSFKFTPKAGVRYKAVIIDRGREQSFRIPDYFDRGYNLQTQSRNDTLELQVLSNLGGGLRNTLLVLHMRGQLLTTLALDENQNAIIKVPLSEFPNGLLTATLFNPIGDPVAERLIFIDAPAIQENLIAKATKNTYSSSAEGKISLQLFAEQDTLPPALLSLSIIQEDFYRATAENIRSYLLLNSDLDVPIEEVGYFFDLEKTEEKKYLLDLLLMTKGWRRFRWRPLLSGDLPEVTFASEEGIYLEGNLLKYDNVSKPQAGKAFFSFLNESFYSEDQVVGEDGHFRFGPYVYYDTAQVLVQGRFSQLKKVKREDLTLASNRYVRIKLKEESHAPLSPLDTPWVWDAGMLDAYRTQSEQTLSIARNFDSLIIDLDVVELTAKRIKKKNIYDQRAALYSNPDNRLIVDSIPGSTAFQSIFDILRRVAGVRVSGPRNQETVEIRGITSIQLSSEPIYILDGTEVNIEILRSYPVFNIAFVDIIRGLRASVYGSRGANGVIMVYSRQGPSVNRISSPGLANVELYGFYKAREFYIPDTSKDSNRPDIRTTLHWQADIITDEAGRANVAFKTSEQKGLYRVIIEGVDANGRPLFNTTTFKVE